ncbi:hypothetical protein AARAC_004895 [Aspergillus arachidicola]|uniref:Zn(2)-C6 fungal-type domain-containing protein n=1 Tax=Aspergillus arachidicola TaxID=656916 RepID=A0A2G7FR11_9EURO|nr:hypothetical protein AARAC_004895 [Aspergillus arachidicola]
MPREPKRDRVRARQACRNCRKKKAKCPSEKPSCSTCIRLKQSCNYDDPRPPDRLADIEKKVDLILSRRGGYPLNDPDEEMDLRWPIETFETPTTTRSNANPLYSSFRSIHGPPNPEVYSAGQQSDQQNDIHIPKPIVPESLISQSLEIYFERFHKQPIWCFDHEDLENPSEICTELLYSVLELTSRFSGSQRQQPLGYGESASASIFSGISKGSVDIETIESLCLLSYSAFIDGNIRLGQFYLGTGFQLCQLERLDQSPTNENEQLITERQKRVIWSLQSLEQFYGEQKGILARSPEDWRPYYVSTRENSLFPQDPTEASTIPEIEIWVFSLHFGWAWSRVREYVSECSQDRLIEPWRLDSTYAKVLADMTEIENKVPLCHRYDKLKFYQRRSDEIQPQRNYWMPWLKLQFTWHAILTTINHPFLYIAASQSHPSLAIPNTFWRRSSELVLLHATWIVRLIDMAHEKKIKLLDPFFAHAAAIAATVHIYFSCAPDSRLRQKSKVDFTKCQKFIGIFSSFSHACERFSRDLRKLSQIAFEKASSDHQWAPSTVRISVPLMWAILQPGIYGPKSAISPLGVVVPGSAIHDAVEDIEENPTLEIGDTETPPTVTIDPSAGYDATLPRYKASSGLQEQTYEDALRETVVPPLGSFPVHTPWLWADPSELTGMDIQGMQPPEPAVGGPESFSTWWDFGNL